MIPPSLDREPLGTTQRCLSVFPQTYISEVVIKFFLQK